MLLFLKQWMSYITNLTLHLLVMHCPLGAIAKLLFYIERQIFYYLLNIFEVIFESFSKSIIDFKIKTKL